MSEAPRTASLSRQADLQHILTENDAENIQQGHLWKDFANGPTNSIYRLALNRIQVHTVGYQRMGAANPLVGGVAQQARQALALPIPVG